MAIVYVQNTDGKPLMPTTRCGHVRILLKEGKAIVVERIPFTIRLCYDTPDITQQLVLGIDPGRTNIGFAVVDETGKAVFAAHVETRNKDIPRLMKARKASRTKHRQAERRAKRRRKARANGTVHASEFKRKLPGEEKPIVLHDIRNKEARFSNRIRMPGWLTPTANQLLETHLNAVDKLAKLLPITDVVFEINRFAFMAMDDPNLKPMDYQHGQLFGYKGSVADAVAAQQDNHCIFCKHAIEHNHHVIPRHKGGSDTLPNIVGLCNKHHGLVHTDDKWATKLKKKKEGLNKKYGALSVLNQIIRRLGKGLASRFPEHVFYINGSGTKNFREDHGIDKDHHLDAYCIAAASLPNVKASVKGLRVYQIQQFRRHDRQACHQEMLNRKYVLDGKVVAMNRHRAYEQKTVSLAEYRKSLIAKAGKVVAETTVSKLAVAEHPPRMKDMRRSLPGSLFVDTRNGKTYVLQGYNGKHGGKINYFVDTADQKHPASKCRIIQNNSGLRFVG